jgi:hypothetical protein
MLIANKHSYREPPARLTEMARAVRAGGTLELPPIPVGVPEAGFRHGVDFQGSGYVVVEEAPLPIKVRSCLLLLFDNPWSGFATTERLLHGRRGLPTAPGNR